mgnify:CR=1 FL=1
MTPRTLEIASSPHVAKGHDVSTIMFNVVLAMLPVAAFAVYLFGLTALLGLLVATLSCVLTEAAVCRFSGRPLSVGDGSAVITGLLYGLTLPPGLPLWMVAAGGILAILVGKAAFGGLGANPFNPALVGRALLQAAFPVAMTSWVVARDPARFTSLPSSTLTLPLTEPVYDSVAGATPLGAWKFEQISTDSVDLLLGLSSGSSGETCAVLVLAGGLYLAVRGMLNWRIPVAILATVGLFAAALQLADPELYPGAAHHLLSGGLMLGAVFMATDMVGSPMTHTGCVLYGALIGVLVVVIRTWGGMSEGVMYAILLGNAVAPHLDKAIRPRVYGTPKRSGAVSS